MICMFWAVFSGGANAWAQELNCRSKTVNVSLKTSTAPTEYIRTKSSNDLTKMHGTAGVNSYVGGLGGGLIGFKTESKFEILTLGNRACVTMRDLEVTFFAKPSIHIANNFRRGTCEYNAVLTHEKKHVRTLLKFVRQTSSEVRELVKKKVRSMDTAYGPIKTSDVTKAQNIIQDEITKEIETLNQGLMPILAKKQEKIDSPQEYRAVEAKCKNWDERLTQNP